MHNSTCHKGSSAKRVLVPKGVIERADDTSHFSDCCHALLMLYFIVLHNNKVNTSLCASKTSHGGLSACTTALVTKVAVPKEYLFLKESSKGQIIPVISPTVVTLYSCFTS
jgi:hypothetical protein